MIYSCIACICFNVVAYNCPHKFFKQLDWRRCAHLMRCQI
ncbi:unnamed protein product [Arabidopsis halleri]